MPDTLEQVLADAREEAAVLKRAGHPVQAGSIDKLCDAIAAAAEDYLTWLNEPDARLQSAMGVEPTMLHMYEKSLAGRGFTDEDGAVHPPTQERLCVMTDFHPGTGWHLSISHQVIGTDGFGEPGRYPTWDEISDARYRFLPDDVLMVMHLPPRAEFVNVHRTTFHLYQQER